MDATLALPLATKGANTKYTIPLLVPAHHIWKWNVKAATKEEPITLSPKDAQIVLSTAHSVPVNLSSSKNVTILTVQPANQDTL